MNPQLLEKWCEHFLLCQVPDSYRYDKVIFTFVSREESGTWSEMCVLSSSVHSQLDHVCMSLVLQQVPKWVMMERSAASKFPESAFSFIVYSLAWSWSFYIVTTHPKGLLSDLASHWNGMCICKIGRCS